MATLVFGIRFFFFFFFLLLLLAQLVLLVLPRPRPAPHLELIVALLLFSAGGLFSIYEGWHKLHAPEALHQVWVALVVLGVSIVLETAPIVIRLLREIARIRRGRSLAQWVRQTRNAELVVVLGEDIAALLGLVIAFIFVWIAGLTGDNRFDAAGSIAIGVVLISISAFIAIRIKRLLVGTSAEEDVEAIAGVHPQRLTSRGCSMRSLNRWDHT